MVDDDDEIKQITLQRLSCCSGLLAGTCGDMCFLCCRGDHVFVKLVPTSANNHNLRNCFLPVS